MGVDERLDELLHLGVDVLEFLFIDGGAVGLALFLKLPHLLRPFAGLFLGLGGFALEFQHLLVLRRVDHGAEVHVASGVQVVGEELVVVDDEVQVHFLAFRNQGVEAVVIDFGPFEDVLAGRGGRDGVLQDQFFIIMDDQIDDFVFGILDVEDDLVALLGRVFPLLGVGVSKEETAKDKKQ